MRTGKHTQKQKPVYLEIFKIKYHVKKVLQLNRGAELDPNYSHTFYTQDTYF